MSERIDFEAEGLLDGLEGEERESRLTLLRRLADDGCTLQELRSAVADGRLALLPVDTSETRGPVGLTMRADAVPSVPQSILMQTVREAAGELS